MFHSETSLKRALAALLAVASVGLSATTHAQSGSSGSSGGGFTQRAEKRAASRWTLQEWLETKERNRMMDLWLSMNSPSPYEFMLGGASLWATREAGAPSTTTTFSSFSGELAAYAQFVGLNAEYENNTAENTNELTGLLNIRLLGNSLQNSFLTLHAGQRTRGFESAGAAQQLRQVATQVSLQLYFSKHFGLDGKYRLYQAATDSTGAEVAGSLSEAGVFIDFGAVRIFGGWSQEKETSTSAGVETPTTRTNVRSGLKLHY